MSGPARPRPLLAGRLLGAGLGLLVALPAFLAVPLSWRPLVVRVASAALLALGCARVLRAVRGAADGPGPSPLDIQPPPPPGPRLDARFTGLRGDLVAGMRSRRYWQAILGPRLLALGGQRVRLPAARGGVARRGPSRAALADLVAELERRG